MHQYIILSALAAFAAVEANPVPQGVTAMISPTASAPSGCSTDYSGSFGIAVITAGQECATATESSDGQPAVTSAVTESSDGQPEVATQLSDGQPEAPMATVATELGDGQPEMPVSELSDGQPEAPATTTALVTESSDGQPEVPTSTTAAVSEATDGQPEVATSTPVVSELSDGQPELPTSTALVTESSDGQPEVPTSTPLVTESSDGQPELPTSTALVTESSDGQPEAATVTQSTDGQPEATGAPESSCAAMQGCASSADLSLTLSNGVLFDSEGRQGYIASNYQFQFNSPPQAGSLYTSGFSVCSNGSLALGGTTVWYECMSGDFYNLYTTDWAPQCSPVSIQAVQLVDC